MSLVNYSTNNNHETIFKAADYYTSLINFPFLFNPILFKQKQD